MTNLAIDRLSDVCRQDIMRAVLAANDSARMASHISPWRITLLLCLAETLNMAGYAGVSALLPELRVAWDLGNAEIGIVEGAFSLGYVTAVTLLVTWTDRRDPRAIYLFSCATGIVALCGLAFVATDLASAALFRFLAGISLAGTYMPGLKMLTDRVEGPRQSRYLSFYTASFSLGAALSTALSGFVGHAFGADGAFALAAGCSLLGGALVVLGTRPRPVSAPGGSVNPLPALYAAFRNRRALAYSLGYAAHMWELHGFRAWLVGYLVFASTGALAPAGDSTLPLWGAIILALGMPASIVGNEVALRIGRRRQLTLVMILSALLAIGFGAASQLPFAALLLLGAIYSWFVTADSASLTAGAVERALPGQRGATMAMHSLLGFGAASLGPLAFGSALDLGGDTSAASWTAGFAILGLGVLLGPLFLRFLLPKEDR
jgi:MFS family permease